MTITWKEAQANIIEYFSSKYSNWNAAFDSNYDTTIELKKVNITKLKMDEIIDKALMSSNFSQLDELFLNISFFAQRHIMHTGKNNLPGENDYCASIKKKRIKGTLE